jgi:hypothetical protein
MLLLRDKGRRSLAGSWTGVQAPWGERVRSEGFSMPTYHVRSVRELLAVFGRHQRDRERRLRAAADAAARAGVSLVKRRVPVAFGELRESVHAETREHDAAVVVDAPHAAPVETGSRPHTPPLAPLVAWVRLRGAQGLLSHRQIDRLPGTSTAGHARSIASALAAMERDGALDVGAPVRIARAIQQAIAKHGTKPHWYARGSLPAIRQVLEAAIKNALSKGP